MHSLILFTLITASPLKLSASLTNQNGILVTLTNRGQVAQVVWKPGNSFHHDSFQIEANVGRKWVPVAQRPVHWKQNAPIFEELQGGKSQSFTIVAGDFTLPKGSSQIRIRYAAVSYPDAKNAEGRQLFRKAVVSAPVSVKVMP